VKVAKPIFIVEPSGRYRVTADMSIGSGIVGSIPIGAAQASVNVDNNRAELNNLTAAVMDGQLNGTATIAFNSRSQSNINANFTNLDLSKLASLQGGRVIPLVGQTSGSVNLTFDGTNLRTAERRREGRYYRERRQRGQRTRSGHRPCRALGDQRTF
jgi:uncharacterized protein involved in outer membrane biogenesis